MADRGLRLLDASTLLIVIEERGELRVAATSPEIATLRLRIARVQGSALGALYLQRKPVALDRPRGQEAAWLHELGLEARAVLVEPLNMDGQGAGMVIALRDQGGFREPDRQALAAFASSVAQRLAAERSVEIERIRYGMEARERERARWAREIHDESIQGIGALRLQLANARDIDDKEALSAAVEEALEGIACRWRVTFSMGALLRTRAPLRANRPAPCRPHDADDTSVPPRSARAAQVPSCPRSSARAAGGSREAAPPGRPAPPTL